jgi:hypothetical protein
VSTLDDWLREATAALKLPADSIPADLRNDLLDVTRDVAHNVARIAGPLTTYLLGLATAHGMAPSAAVELIQGLAKQHQSAPEPNE